ncbi:MAG: S1C family serine protease [Aggregatilineales bacterium]
MVHSLKRHLSLTVFSSVLIITGFMLGVIFVPQFSGAASDESDFFNRQIGGELIRETERVFSEVYNRSVPGVVSINIAEQSDSDEFFGTSSGSGFVIDAQGHIVTNNHVVEGADRIEVRFFDGTITRAEIVGVDPDSDIAVIKVNLSPDRLRPLPFADSNSLVVGETVLAIGNPFSNDWTLTSGIISALDRRIIGLNQYAIGGVIQTDAAINPGNSGGPLMNLEGQVIGVNSQIEGGLRQNAGIGFSVPSNLVSRVSQELIASGTVRYSYMGISSRSIDLDLMEQFNLPDNLRGVAIRQVQQDGPASSAGLQTMGNSTIDVITAINGVPMRDFDDMIGWLTINTRPGEQVNVTIYRAGSILNVPIVLTDRPGR